MVVDKIKTDTKKKKDFRIRSKTFFLTYSALEDIKDYENKILFNKILLSFEKTFSTSNFEYLICKELHEDGQPHIHALLKFKSVKRVYSREKLTLNIDEFSFQGKYESAKNVNSVISYITKENNNPQDIHTNMNLPTVGGEFIPDPYEYLLQVYKSEGYQVSIKRFREKFPNVFLKKGNSILKNLGLYHQNIMLHKGEQSVLSYELKDFNLSKQNLKALDDWIKGGCARTLMVSGLSGSGKSELAKAVMSHINSTYLFVRNIEGLKRFCSLHQGIIFDDLDFTRFEHVSDLSELFIGLFDTMNPSEIRVLYGSVHLPAGLVKIITTNKPNAYLVSDAVKRRIVHFRIKNSLFNNSKKEKGDIIEFKDH